jgi:hypothetical integral membrane protein (TIGR02206 family)
MWQYFWIYYTDLPPGAGTPNFGPVHLAWLGTGLAAVVLAVLAYRRLGQRARHSVQITLAVLLMCNDIGILSWLALGGHFSLAECLPLQLCSAAVWLEPAGVFSRSRLLREFSYCCLMPGALAAMLTPSWVVYPFLNVQYLESVVNHTLLVMIPAIWIWGDSFRPSLRRLPACLGLLLALAGIGALVNHWVGSDYMFLAWAPPGTILAVFDSWLGTPGYLLPLAGLILVVWAALYAPWVIIGRARRKDPARASELP